MKYSDDNNKKNNPITLPMVFLLSITLLGYECKERPHRVYFNPSSTPASTSADQPAVADTDRIVTKELIAEVKKQLFANNSKLQYSNPGDLAKSFELLTDVLTDLNNNKTTSLNTSKSPHTQASALHLAVKLGHLPTVKALVNCGADFNAVNIHNETPLYYAAKEMGNPREMGVHTDVIADIVTYFHEDIIAYLVNLGANQSIATTATNQPKTAYDVVDQFIKYPQRYQIDNDRKTRLQKVKKLLEINIEEKK